MATPFQTAGATFLPDRCNIGVKWLTLGSKQARQKKLNRSGNPNNDHKMQAANASRDEIATGGIGEFRDFPAARVVIAWSVFRLATRPIAPATIGAATL